MTGHYGKTSIGKPSAQVGFLTTSRHCIQTVANFKALFRLNHLIGLSPILWQYVPIQIIASGGYVSLW